MKIIDIIICSYRYVAKDKGIRNLDASIIGANLFFMLNEVSLFQYFEGQIIKILSIEVYSSTLVVIGLIFGIIAWYFTLRALEREYLNKSSYTRILNTYVPKVLGILIVIIHWLASSFMLVYSFSFLPYNPKIA